MVVILVLVVASLLPASPAVAAGPEGRVLFARSPDVLLPTGSPELLAFEFAVPTVRRLAGPTTPPLDDPIYSPDGTMVAFNRDSSGSGLDRDLWVMEVATGIETEVAAGDSHAVSGVSWAPDSARLVFADTALDPSDGEPVGSKIVVVGSDGSNPEVLTSGRYDTSPRWSPDGSHISFASGTVDSFSSTLMSIAPDGTGEAVIAAASDMKVGRSAWSPDGATILFEGSSEVPDRTRLYVVPASGGPTTPLASGTDDYYSLEAAVYREPDPWSPDGTRIMFMAQSADPPGYRTLERYFVLSLDDGHLAEVRPSVGSRTMSMPVWSPDGSHLAFSGRVDGASTIGIYTSTADVTDVVGHTGGASDVVFDWIAGVGPAPGPAIIGLIDSSQGRWHLFDDTGVQTTQFYFGDPGDQPFVGDWDCDGVDTPGLYRESDGFVYLRNHNTQGTADVEFFFGNPGDIPLPGDFNGDGCDTVSVYRPSNQTFYIINELGSDSTGLGAAEVAYVFGDPGDTPIAGDFDGDGTDTVGLHRDTTGLVYLRNSHTTGNADLEFYFGNPDDQFIVADWNGDGTDTPGVRRSSVVYLKYTNAAGTADATIELLIPNPGFGSSGWQAVAGRFG